MLPVSIALSLYCPWNLDSYMAQREWKFQAQNWANTSVRLLFSPGLQKGTYDIALTKTLQRLRAYMGCPCSTVMPYVRTDNNLLCQNGRIPEGETTGEITPKKLQNRANTMQS